MEAKFRKIVSGEDTGLAARLLRPVLGAVAGPYRLVVAARNRLYDAGVLPAHWIAAPVVSIGNITLGGTGKTPLVQFICRWFLDRRRRPVILSRGYRSVGGHNDEALLLHANLPDVPHLQGKNRVAIARRAVEEFRPDVLVLDDGLQHRRLARDLDIVLIDCTEPFGYGHVFPRGLLREPLAALRRADVVVLSRSNQRSESEREEIRRTIQSVAGDKPVALAEHRPVALWSSDGRSTPIAALAGRSVAAFCGVGNPEAFWETLRGLRCTVLGMRTFPDHYRYRPSDSCELESWIRNLAPDVVVTTQKDLVKVAATQLGDRPLHAVRIEVAVTEGAGALDRSLASVFTERAAPARAA